MIRIAMAMGTRPEVIKFAPLVEQISSCSEMSPLVIYTGQHAEMAEQVFSAFDIKPDISLDLMQDGQTPNQFLSRLLIALEPYLEAEKVDGLLVQGDTTSALGASLTAFHQGVRVAHVEAGLRTFRKDAPFPEEMNRCVIGQIASLHFCPTNRAEQNLKLSGIEQQVYVTGNTVIDAALSMKSRIDAGLVAVDADVEALCRTPFRKVLVTGHRRENFDRPMRNLCSVLRTLRDRFSDIEIVFPVHLNPRVKGLIEEELKQEQRIHLVSPLDYPSLLALMSESSLIVTDSGGIQEEAPSFGVPVLVTREVTERQEALEAGLALLAPLTNTKDLLDAATDVLSGDSPIVAKDNPFGDGKAAKKIVEIIREQWA
jgi:UDP-N-acetylglucosamine 2-epimerase (non-hydrolysing)